LALVQVRAWQAAYTGLMPQAYLDGLDVAERAGAWRQRLVERREDARTLVATVERQVAAFTAFGSARDPESGDGGELYALNVHPDHWREGVGSALLSASHAGLAELGHHRTVLWVVAGNVRARRFYERHGWMVEPDERSLVVPGATVPEVRYAKDLP
jgi:GNAT superfamily N-acetyltransferase